MNTVKKITGKVQESPRLTLSLSRAAIAQCVDDPRWVEVVDDALSDLQRAKEAIDAKNTHQLDSILRNSYRSLGIAIADLEKANEMLQQ